MLVARCSYGHRGQRPCRGLAGVSPRDGHPRSQYPPDLGCDSIVQGQAVVSVGLDRAHGDNHSVTIMGDTKTALRPEVPGAQAPDLVDHELVIREARRRQHRRWIVTGIVVVAVAVVVTAIGLTRGNTIPHRSSPRPAPTRRITPTAPAAVGVVPEQPASLAVGPNGNLYVADDTREQVLERLPDGTFVPIVGNGTAGFSGDGGPATSAQLDDPSGIAFGPGGTLYIADTMNGRIRAVSASGIISTIAGSGSGVGWITDGTPALEAVLQPTAIAFGPDRLMYVSNFQQVLRLEPNGTFTDVLGKNTQYVGLYGIDGPAASASANGAEGLAFDSAGNLYVFAFNDKNILMIDRQGIVKSLGSLYPRGPSGLVTAPDGSVIAMDELGVVRLSPKGIQTLVRFPMTDKVAYLGVTGFSPGGVAVGPNGLIYLDTWYGNGYADKSAIIAIPAYGSGKPSSLWEQQPSH